MPLQLLVASAARQCGGYLAYIDLLSGDHHSEIEYGDCRRQISYEEDRVLKASQQPQEHQLYQLMKLLRRPTRLL
jgi:hypothetical protein